MCLVAFLGLAVCVSVPTDAQSKRTIILATTTSTQDSGLLDVLVPRFEKESGIEVKVIAVGTGAALRMAARGDADVILVHAPAAEQPYVQAGDLVDGRPVMHNDFVIVGPSEDPAGIRPLRSVNDVMRAIAARGTFVSRGDDSGTDAQERALWAAARIDRRALSRREETGQGMGATLNVADQRRAYTLTDRGTYLSLRRRLGLVILFQGDASLRNVYHVYAVNPAKHPGVKHVEARAFIDFLVSAPIQEMILPSSAMSMASRSSFRMRCTYRLDRRHVGEWLAADTAARAIALRTMLVSGAASGLAVLVGVPIGYAIARRSFRGRTILLGLINTGMGMPPVVVGLVVWLLLVRSGPFGGLNLIYTQRAMILAQFLIATPIVVGFTTASFQALPPRLADLLVVLGAGRLRTLWLLAREAKLGLLVAIMAAFGAIVSEVGASMVVGGNLERSTRVLTTAIVTETSRGEVERALTLGLVLLMLSFVVNLTLTIVQQRHRG